MPSGSYRGMALLTVSVVSILIASVGKFQIPGLALPEDHPAHSRNKRDASLPSRGIEDPFDSGWHDNGTQDGYERSIYPAPNLLLPGQCEDVNSCYLGEDWEATCYNFNSTAKSCVCSQGFTLYSDGICKSQDPCTLMSSEGCNATGGSCVVNYDDIKGFVCDCVGDLTCFSPEFHWCDVEGPGTTCPSSSSSTSSSTTTTSSTLSTTTTTLSSTSTPSTSTTTISTSSTSTSIPTTSISTTSSTPSSTTSSTSTAPSTSATLSTSSTSTPSSTSTTASTSSTATSTPSTITASTTTKIFIDSTTTGSSTSSSTSTTSATSTSSLPTTPTVSTVPMTSSSISTLSSTSTTSSTTSASTSTGPSTPSSSTSTNTLPDASTSSSTVSTSSSTQINTMSVTSSSVSTMPSSSTTSTSSSVAPSEKTSTISPDVSSSTTTDTTTTETTTTDRTTTDTSTTTLTTGSTSTSTSTESTSTTSTTESTTSTESTSTSTESTSTSTESTSTSTTTESTTTDTTTDSTTTDSTTESTTTDTTTDSTTTETTTESTTTGTTTDSTTTTDTTTESTTTDTTTDSTTTTDTTTESTTTTNTTTESTTTDTTTDSTTTTDTTTESTTTDTTTDSTTTDTTTESTTTDTTTDSTTTTDTTTESTTTDTTTDSTTTTDTTTESTTTDTTTESTTTDTTTESTTTDTTTDSTTTTDTTTESTTTTDTTTESTTTETTTDSTTTTDTTTESTTTDTTTDSTTTDTTTESTTTDTTTDSTTTTDTTTESTTTDTTTDSTTTTDTTTESTTTDTTTDSTTTTDTTTESTTTDTTTESTTTDTTTESTTTDTTTDSTTTTDTTTESTTTDTTTDSTTTTDTTTESTTTDTTTESTTTDTTTESTTTDTTTDSTTTDTTTESTTTDTTTDSTTTDTTTDSTTTDTTTDSTTTDTTTESTTTESTTESTTTDTTTESTTTESTTESTTTDTTTESTTTDTTTESTTTDTTTESTTTDTTTESTTTEEPSTTETTTESTTETTTESTTTEPITDSTTESTTEESTTESTTTEISSSTTAETTTQSSTPSECVPAPACVVTQKSANLWLMQSPEYPANYEVSTICEWNWSCPSATVYEISFLDFEIPSNDFECTDALIKFTNFSTTGTSTLCGYKTGAVIRIGGSDLDIFFKASSSLIGKFSIAIKAVDCVDTADVTELLPKKCPSTTEAPTTTEFTTETTPSCRVDPCQVTKLSDNTWMMESPNSPANYSINSFCQWKFSCPTATRYNIAFVKFNVPSEDFGCTDAYIKMATGETSTLCGIKTGALVTLDGDTLDLTFQGSGSLTGNFKLFIEAVDCTGGSSQSSAGSEGCASTTATPSVTPPCDPIPKCPVTQVATDLWIMESPGYSSNYPLSSVCDVTWSCPSATRYVITFLDFNVISSDFACTDAMLKFTSLTTSDISTLCGIKTGAVISIKGSSLDILFQASSTLFGKFKIAIKAVGCVDSSEVTDLLEGQCATTTPATTTEPACRIDPCQVTRLSDNTWLMDSPMYPANYSVDSYCQWNFGCPTATRYNIAFVKFEVPSEDFGCTDSYIQMASSETSTLCGIKTGALITLDGSTLDLTFQGSSSLTGYFRLFIEAVDCAGDSTYSSTGSEGCSSTTVSPSVTTPGCDLLPKCPVTQIASDLWTMESPDYSSNYPLSSVCDLTWSCPSATRYVITFLDFNVISSDFECTDAMLKFKSLTTADISTLCGIKTGAVIAIKGSSLDIFFQASGSLYGKFKIAIKAVGCVDTAEVTDFLEGQCASTTTTAVTTTVAPTCASSVTCEVTQMSSNLWTIKSPDYSALYPASSTCEWTWKCPSATSYIMSFVDFQIPSSDFECVDGMMKFASLTDSQSSTLCGIKTGAVVKIPGSEMDILFKGSSSLTGKFNVAVKAVGCTDTAEVTTLTPDQCATTLPPCTSVCPVIQKSDTLWIMQSPDYPSIYALQSTCEWKWECSSATAYEISFLDFQVPSTDFACTDALLKFTSLTASEISTLCGIKTGAKITIHGSALDILFKGGSLVGGKFNIAIKAIGCTNSTKVTDVNQCSVVTTPAATTELTTTQAVTSSPTDCPPAPTCEVTQTSTSTWVMDSPDYASTYPLSSTCDITWKCTGATGYRVIFLTYAVPSVDIACTDAMTEFTAVEKSTLCGIKTGARLSFTGESLEILFKGSGSLAGKFKMSVQALGCTTGANVTSAGSATQCGTTITTTTSAVTSTSTQTPSTTTSTASVTTETSTTTTSTTSTTTATTTTSSSSTTAATCSAGCSLNQTSTNSFVWYSPDFPQNYPVNSHCHVELTCDTATSMYVSFTTFQVTSTDTACTDASIIFSSLTVTNYAKLCGVKTGSALSIPGNKIIMDFDASSAIQGKFQLNIRAVGCLSTSTVTANPPLGSSSCA